MLINPFLTDLQPVNLSIFYGFWLVLKLQVLDLYVWLSFRLEESFPDHELAVSQKAICSMCVLVFMWFTAFIP